MKLLGIKYNGNHVQALLKKDYLVRRRQWLMTLVQYAWPCIIFFALYLLRNRFHAYTNEECQFPTRQLPSQNNLLPFFHSYICTIENKCMSTEQYREVPDYEAAPVTPILNIVQMFLNEPKLYDAIIKLPIEKNFIATVIAVVTHPKFTLIEANANKMATFLPQIEKIVGADFDPMSMFSNSHTLSNFGKILCASPFPRADDNLNIVNNILESEDFNGADVREVRSLPTDYCKKLYRDVTKTNQGKITWSAIKPIIQGKILYGPDNERTREIVRNANTTFNDMSRLSTFLHSIDSVFEMLKSDKEFREKYDQLIRLAKSPFVKQLAGESFNADEIEATLNGILNDKRIASTINVIANIFDCYSVDRFVPVENESELEDTAYELSKSKMLYSSVFFTQTDHNQTTYKLRMDTDDTPVTALTENLYWFPGPEGSFVLDLRYHRGFIQIQHSLDQAIIEVERAKMRPTNDSVESDFSNWDDASSTTPADNFGEFDDEDVEDDFDEFENDSTTPAPAVIPPSLMSKLMDSFTTSLASAATTPDDLDVSSTETVTETAAPVKRRKKRQLTNLLDTFFSRSNNAKETSYSDMKFFTKQFPYPSYVTDDFKRGVYMANAVQVAFFFALIVQVASAVRHRIWMKESGNITLMRTMGLVKSAEVVSWIITCLIELAIIFVLVLCIMYGGGMIAWPSKGLLFVFLLLYGFSVVSFSFMTSTFFSSASIGTVSVVIFFLITFLPYVVVVSLGTFLTMAWKIVASLSASTAFCYAWRYILRTELQQKPFDFSNAFAGSLADNDFKFGCLMIVIDLVLYAVIGAICERFLHDDNNFHEVTRKNINKDHGAEVLNVTKVYPSSNKKAVDDVYLVFKRDQVTALLGRNGAGKSTIIKMLTGQLKPTMGEINLPPNYDLISGNKNNQEKIGLCSQSNTLIPNLTAKEHLELYAKIKMRSGFNAEIKRIFNSLNFGKYRKFQAKELSGGYKRRLCIAIAFLASPNLVILDEPCSGVDTRARKNIWDLIQILRKGRAVVLATHFMDEAERLSDKIVIINQGKVVSESTAETLSNEFTKSFELNIHLTHGQSEKERSTITDQIKNTIQEKVPTAHTGHSTSSSYTLNVPYKNESGEYYNFEAILRYLESLQVQRKILSFNITNQNLKDIFNRFNQYDLNGHGGEINGNSEIPMKEMEEEREVSWLTIVLSLFWKRLTHFTRNYRMLLAILVLPVIFECLAMIFLQIRPPGEYDVALTMGKELYPRSTEFYSFEESMAENDTTSEFTQPIYDNLVGQCGEGQCELFNSSHAAFKWLLSTEYDFIQKRYGGVTINDTNLEVWYNNKGYHAMPTYVNLLNNAILRNVMNDSSYRITTVNHPLKLGDGVSYSSILQQVADAGVSLIILVAFSLVLAGASVYIVNERVSGEKLQQRLCGVNFRTYWGVTFVWDFIIFGIALASAAAVFELFGMPLYTDKEQLPGICLLLFLFGFAIIPAVHIFEKLFSEPSFANMSLFCMNVIIALTTMTLILILEVIGTTKEEEQFRKLLNKVFIILPQHALSDGLRQIIQNYIASKVLERFFIDSYKSPVTSDLLAMHFISLLSVGIICNIANYIIESKLPQKLLTKKESSKESSSVSTELEFISIQNTLKRLDTYDMARNNFALSVQNLKKRYHGHSDYAVRDVSFHVKDGECFGLLGANGAGKSTIFSILCGEIIQTSGHVKLRSERGISYCPQSNALDPLLTVTEVIRFYGRLRKIRDLDQLTKKTLESLHLSQYKNVLVKNLSGGNRRKLSVAVCCFGNTNLVLMDEPTSDMDPITRGLVYKVIKGLIKSNRAVVLTSHSISEIESICHKIIVLKEGKVLSTGTPRQLKDNYGNSYLVKVFHGKESEKIDILSTFPTATRILEHNYSTQFMIKVKFSDDDIENGDLSTGMHPDSDDENNKKILLSDLFARLDSLRVSHNIMYTISECLLDQVLETILENSEPESSQGYVNKAFKQTETLT